MAVDKWLNFKYDEVLKKWSRLAVSHRNKVQCYFFKMSKRKNKEKSTYVEVHVETWGFRWVCVQPNNDALPRDCATLYRWQQQPLGGHESGVQRVLKGVERAQHTVKKSGWVLVGGQSFSRMC